MSSGFISETEIVEARKKRQEEWERVRQPNQPIEYPEVPYDSRSLYERLKEQKDQKDFEFEEAHKLKNLIRGLDDDEVDFLDVIDKAKMNADKQQQIDELRELQDFRMKVASLQEKSLDDKILAEVAKPKVKPNAISTRPSQKAILTGLVRKRKASETTDEINVQPSNTNEMKLVQSDSSAMPSSPSTNENDTVVHSSKLAKITTNTSLKCIGILPGIGKYSDSSDSENSSDIETTDDIKYDWIGRKIEKKETNCE